ncbi:DctP family TRAP transporter solute-binding subunit [Nesterenkonia sphaerica]|uniref:DctP family TRAP transporter solute-binding subunit n=1 Tax=Nesterenkonia sphaerica TaxID=1804988 RepID=A0A5R9AG09_9MICC|nr:DctP family TRAP transporter solute-binding subunit [Nesterenkonia sphaerica]TLP77518.1 DctP family TRAP transporter solute-binding subunit [Nesterenkonia sphaerica]
MSTRKTPAVTTAIVLAALLAGCANGGADEEQPEGEGEVESQTLRMAIGDPAASSVGVTADHFAEEVAERTGGSIEIETHPDGTLFGGDQNAAVNLLGNGTLDCTIISTSVYASFDARMNAMSLPYLFDDEEQFTEYLQGEPGQELLDSLESEGIKGIQMLTRTPRHITNSVRPIEEPSDLDGITIRVPQNELWVNFFGSLGANPTPMDFTEVYTALQTGTIDAQENPLEVPVNNRFFEVQDYLSLTEHIRDGYVLGCNQDLWESLEAEQQEAMTEAAENTFEFRIEDDQRDVEETLASLEEEGVNVNELTSEAKQEFQDAAEEVYPQFSSLVGEEFFETTLEYVGR